MANNVEHGLDSLWGSEGTADEKLDVLNKTSGKAYDGLLRIDMKKVKDSSVGYRLTVRLLPNITKDKTFGEYIIKKVSHYVDIKNEDDLSGYFDSPSNFTDESGKPLKCGLSSLFYSLDKSQNAVLKENAKCLNYNKKYFSYCLVLEDNNQPENVGKIMILSFGETLSEKILLEKKGENADEKKCNVYDLSEGKDFVIIAKNESKDPKQVDYATSYFKSSSSVSLYNEEKKSFKKVPLVDGKIDPKFRNTIVDFLLKRDYELESFAPKRLTDAQIEKIGRITNYLTGKTTTSAPKATNDDFDFEETVTKTEKVEKTETKKQAATKDDDDDFFNM